MHETLIFALIFEISKVYERGVDFSSPPSPPPCLRLSTTVYCPRMCSIDCVFSTSQTCIHVHVQLYIYQRSEIRLARSDLCWLVFFKNLDFWTVAQFLSIFYQSFSFFTGSSTHINCKIITRIMWFMCDKAVHTIV